MGHGHTHGRGHSTVTGAHRRVLAVVLGVTLTVLVLEVVGALVSGSLALLADAGHLATDSTGIGLALLAAGLARRTPTARRTFGWQRAEILAALANAVLLLGVGVWVVVEAVRRLLDPPDVDAGVVLVVATVGLAANLGCLALLRRGSRSSLNVRGAYLEVLSDALASAAVIVSAAVIAITGWLAADPVVSLGVGLLVLPRAWHLLREAAEVLLEATPSGVDLDRVRHHMSHVQGVVSVHDVHAWTITSGLPVLSAHVAVEDEVLAARGVGAILDDLGGCLADHFDVEHSTIQIEPARHRDHEPVLHD